MKTWKTVDKSGWPNRGQWDDEPDKAQWIDKETNFDCLIVRNRSGALCGYVGVPTSNKFHGKHYDAVMLGDEENEYPEVHGGLTFSDKCSPVETESTGICHSGNVANENVWWLGFDCAHLGDKCPANDFSFEETASYKTFGYVKREVEGLAHQLAEAT